MSLGFPSSRFTALRRALAVDALAYAQTHRHLAGQVTRLAPYLTHGLISTAEVFDCWRLRRGLTLRDPLCQELAWREYFQHVWRHRAEDILGDMQPRPTSHRLPQHLPADIRRAATGIPVIDLSVRELYNTGYLHHHQRLWLASYCVHVRKLAWRSAADWMYGHLLDGDLASNHLSWQGVSGGLNNKPYVFNNDSVRRFAPALDSPGSLLDRSYADMEQLAMNRDSAADACIQGSAVREPELLARPPSLHSSPGLASAVRARKVALIHPWMLERRPQADLVVGVIHLPFHARFPWSAKRWNFVLTRMNALCDAFFVGDLEQAHLWLNGVDIAASEATLNPGYRKALQHARVQLADPPRALPEPGTQCASYHAWLKALMRLAPELFDRSLADQLVRLRHAENARACSP